MSASFDPVILLLGIYFKEMTLNAKKAMCVKVFFTGPLYLLQQKIQSIPNVLTLDI